MEEYSVLEVALEAKKMGIDIGDLNKLSAFFKNLTNKQKELDAPLQEVCLLTSGDLLLSLKSVKQIVKEAKPPKIDLLDDTLGYIVFLASVSQFCAELTNEIVKGTQEIKIETEETI